MYFPSGVHSGEMKSVVFSFVTCTVSEPSAAMSHRFSAPLRSDTKTMRSPSGLNRGCTSYAMPCVMLVASPPVAGIV